MEHSYISQKTRIKIVYKMKCYDSQQTTDYQNDLIIW